MESSVPASDAVRPKPSRLRRSVRWCRRIALFVVLLLVYGFVHLNQFGVPDILKQPLLQQLRSRGLSLDFSRLRVRLGRGLVAENVTIDRPGEQAGEHFYLEEVQLKLDWTPLTEFRAPEILALKLRKGLVQIPVPDDGPDAGPPYLFQVTDVSGTLAFLGPESWELQSLEATSHGGQFRASGSLTNVSVLRSRKPAKPASMAWKRPLRRIGRTLDKAQYSGPPVVSIAFHADLRSAMQSTADIEVKAPGVRYAGSEFKAITATAQFNQPPGTNDFLPAVVRIEAAEAVTRWGSLSGFTLDASGELSATNAFPDSVNWWVRAQGLRSPWGSAGKVSLQGTTAGTNRTFTSRISLDTEHLAASLSNAPIALDRIELSLTGRHSLTNWLDGAGELKATTLHSPWSDLDRLSLQLSANHSSPPTGSHFAADLPAPVQQFDFTAAISASNLVAHLPQQHLDLPVRQVETHVAWSRDHNGELIIRDLTASTPAGSVNVQGAVNSASRLAQADFQGALDLHAYTALLTPAAQHWLGQYGWQSNAPPSLSGSVAVTLPSWTNRHPDWRGEVVPTLRLSGHVAGTNFFFRDIPGDTAAGDFIYTNHVWRIPSMTATRPEGAITFSYEGNDQNHSYHFRLRSTIDPMVVRPLLTSEKLQHSLAELRLSGSPVLEGDVWGVWREAERTGLDVRLAVTNFVYRNEPIESVSGRLQFTNLLLSFSDAELHSLGWAVVPGGAFDIATHRLSFTNTRTHLDPLRVARVIGEKSAKVMSNYLFGVPPNVTLNGVIGVGTNLSATDIRVTADAPEFHWWRLGLTNARAKLHFLGETLALTDLATDLHGGKAEADLYFDWAKRHPGVNVRGQVGLTNLHLAGLMQTVGSPSNHLEGFLQGQVHFLGNSTVTNGWAGTGSVEMHDGFLWGVPIFGIFSKLFDAISPGLGQSRFKEGRMNFTVTNSVLSTRDLSVRSAAMRLAYRGTVDLTSRIDARMEAELFRDTPVIGPLLTFVLTPFAKLFIYDVKGTLKKPIAEPRYVPKFFLAPLRPLKTLRELLPIDEGKIPAESEPEPKP